MYCPACAKQTRSVRTHASICARTRTHKNMLPGRCWYTARMCATRWSPRLYTQMHSTFLARTMGTSHTRADQQPTLCLGIGPLCPGICATRLGMPDTACTAHRHTWTARWTVLTRCTPPCSTQQGMSCTEGIFSRLRQTLPIQTRRKACLDSGQQGRARTLRTR